MNHDASTHTRRTSGAVNVATPSSIPSAPPLPAPRPLQRAREAATRFFGYPSRPPSPELGLLQSRFGRNGFGRQPSLGADQNATASHKTGLEINALAIKESGTHVLIAGKEIFKTIKVENGTCAEDLNLRSAIRSTPNAASGVRRQSYSIDIADVAWAKGDCGDYVAAATSSGKIILYDLGHAGLQAAQLHEHFRQVHRVTFNPHRGSLLLSGSQDGTVRLWDLRDVRSASTVQSKRKYPGQSDGVRDVKWSPTEGVDFAFGTDSGWIQRWDMRNLKTAKLKIPAHSLAVNAIDWHLDGKHIVSASLDRSIRIWDFSAGRRGQRASWEITTPFPVFNARWRPACESSSMTDHSLRQCTQVVTSYDNEHPTLHIWDLRRPALPFREFSPYLSAPTDLVWHSQDLLWTVGREGIFLQTDVQHTSKVVTRRNLQAVAVSAKSEVTFVTQRRRVQRMPYRPALTSPLPSFSKTSLPHSSSLSQSPEHSSLSRSWADDSVDHSFLTSSTSIKSPKKKRQIRTHSMALPDRQQETSSQAVMNLSDALTSRTVSRPAQHAVRGTLPGADDHEMFSRLADMYEPRLNNQISLDDPLLPDVVEDAFEYNAHVTLRERLNQDAQAWRILGLAAKTHLEKLRAAGPSITLPVPLHEMMQQIISHSAKTGNAQFGAVLIITVLPILPRLVAPQDAQLLAMKEAYHAYVASYGITIEPIVAEKVEIALDHFVRAGLNPLECSAVLATYHDQLRAHQLYVSATLLRNLAFPLFPAVYADAMADTTLCFKCGECGKNAANIKNESTRKQFILCENCGPRDQICWFCRCLVCPFPTRVDQEREEDGSEIDPALMTTCPGCGHAVHVRCVQEILENDIDACGTPGCLCVCFAEG